MRILELSFRHRSSAVLFLVWPLVAWALLGRPLEPWQALLGAGLLVGGAALRLASARCLGRGARVHRAGARGGLVTWGPYRWSRNPLYVAAALILAGLGLLAGGGPWALLLLPATALVYTPVVLHEERALRADVGQEVDAYRAAVWRWLGPPGPAPAQEPERSPWAEVLRREAGLIPGLTIGAASVLAVGSGALPVAELLGRLGSVVGATPAALAAAALALGLVGNSLAVERKRRRHDARRAAKAAAEGALAEGQLAEAGAAQGSRAV